MSVAFCFGTVAVAEHRRPTVTRRVQTGWDTRRRDFYSAVDGHRRGREEAAGESWRDSLCRRDVHALVFVERTKRLQVVEEFVGAFCQGVVDVQDALQGAKSLEKDTGRLTLCMKQINKWERLRDEVCSATSSTALQVRRLLPVLRKKKKKKTNANQLMLSFKGWLGSTSNQKKAIWRFRNCWSLFLHVRQLHSQQCVYFNCMMDLVLICQLRSEPQMNMKPFTTSGTEHLVILSGDSMQRHFVVSVSSMNTLINQYILPLGWWTETAST